MNYLSPLACKRFIILCDISWRYGLIGINEYRERMKALRWLSSDQEEPDSPDEEDSQYTEKQQEEFLEDTEKNHLNPIGSDPDEDTRYDDPENLRLEILIGGKNWVFTLGDADPYPSVPHGHFEKKTRRWPKLNPYTGEIFSGKDKIDSCLKKKHHIELWENQKFYDDTLKQVNWYKEEYGFSNQLKEHFKFLNSDGFTSFKG